MNALAESLGVAARADAGTPLVSLRGVTKTYRRGSMAVDVLHGVSLDIRPGEFVALMGASGSGKSTLMNLIGLLDRPSGGSYRFAGEETTGLDADGRACLRRDAFGFVFQQFNLLGTASAAANVEMPAIYAGLPHRRRVVRARELLARLGLADRTDHRPGQLSGGQQQRVAIARALMNGGAMILADEPTGALDSRSGAEVMALLRDLNGEGHTILLVTHDPAVAAQAGRVIELRDGRIVSDTENAGAVVPVGRDLSRPSPPRRYPIKGEGVAEMQREIPLPPRGGGPGRWGATDTLDFRRAGFAVDLVEAARAALAALRNNLMRTLLTLLGIIIGVGSVVAMLAIGDGAKREVLDRIASMGTDLLLVRPGAPNVRGSGGVATLVVSDADAIATLPNVAASVPAHSGGVTVRYRGVDLTTSAEATSGDFARARSWPLAEGTFFSAADVDTYAPVAVLGQTVARALFAPGESPLGAWVMVNNAPFQVIGTLAAKGATPFGGDYDDMLWVPVTTGMQRLFGQRHMRTIFVQVDDVAGIDATERDIHALLMARHQTEDFQIRNMASILETATATQNTLTLLLGSIAVISLIVGGIGVMNIMLVSVTERTREIGVRMAVGARRRNIMLQFNGEALAICTVGGLLGVGVGLGAVAAFAAFGRPVLVTPGPVILAFACAFLTGLVFGWLPARKAARLDPVVALASE